MNRIGVQLYTVRHALEHDFDGTLARVAALGYSEVEFAGYFDRSAVRVARSLQQSGLTAPSAHVPFSSLGDGESWSRILEDAHTLGHRYLVAWIDREACKDFSSCQRVAERFNRAGEEAATAGIGVAYHNHDHEFEPLQNGGKLRYDVLLEAMHPEHVLLELDLYWIARGGQDPMAYFNRWPGRIKLVHVKDSSGPPEHRIMDVGSGTLDWPSLLPRCAQAGVEHFFVEHDHPADPFASIKASYHYLNQVQL